MQRKPQRRGLDGRFVPSWYPPDPEPKEPLRVARADVRRNLEKISSDKKGARHD